MLRKNAGAVSYNDTAMKTLLFSVIKLSADTVILMEVKKYYNIRQTKKDKKEYAAVNNFLFDSKRLEKFCSAYGLNMDVKSLRRYVKAYIKKHVAKCTTKVASKKAKIRYTPRSV